jgi:NDP-sugar pyrophosphorylase family protein
MSITPFNSLVLFGGMGRRLNANRRLINSQFHCGLQDYQGIAGPKALALLTLQGHTKPLIDWHLALHSANKGCQNIYLGLGAMANYISLYCVSKFSNCFNDIPLVPLTEQNPAGTIAPLIKMHRAGLLGSRPLLMSNGDNIITLDFEVTLQAGLAIIKANECREDLAVIDVVSPIAHSLSESFGVVDIDPTSQMARSFIEKGAIEQNPYEIINGQKYCWINSGFSIIVNPQAFFNYYVTSGIIKLSTALELGELDYKSYEKQVKYETLYQKVAGDGQMVAIKNNSYWADSGTEQAMAAIEANYRP